MVFTFDGKILSAGAVSAFNQIRHGIGTLRDHQVSALAPQEAERLHHN
jgi:hypothetical protein